MLSRMQFIIQYQDAIQLPAGEIVNIFENLRFIRVVNVEDSSPVILFSATFMRGRKVSSLKQIPSLELRDVLHLNGREILFSAQMSGPVAQLLVVEKEAWPIAPIIIEKEQLVLSMQGTSAGLSNFLVRIKSVIGSRFKLTVNKAYQGEWLTAPNMSPRRKKVLETAIDMGYYDHPRQCKQQDIALQLQRKQGTIAEHLLLAEGNILKAWFEQSRSSE